MRRNRDDINKTCSRCKQRLSLELFYKHKKNNPKKNDGYSSRCRKCERAIYAEHRFALLNHYSNGDIKCVCCGERELAFMSLDHISGGGNKHRKEFKHTGYNLCVLHAWCKRNNYPPIFRVLCHNCNMAIGFFGSCPHQDHQ
jgi:hypothetical protein